MRQKLPNNPPAEGHTCPNCKGTLIVKTNRETQAQFLGCPNYPTCDHTEPITEALRMKLLGAPTLF